MVGVRDDAPLIARLVVGVRDDAPLVARLVVGVRNDAPLVARPVVGARDDALLVARPAVCVPDDAPLVVRTRGRREFRPSRTRKALGRSKYNPAQMTHRTSCPGRFSWKFEVFFRAPHDTGEFS
jgi:hypothetical protein